MTDHVSGFIADCERKIAELNGVLEKLRWFQREFPHTAAAVVPIEKPRRTYTRRAVVVKKVKAAKPASQTRGTTAINTPDDETLTQRILAQLRKRAPMSLGDLTAAVEADKVLVRKRVKKLEAAGQVRTTGVTTQRLIHLVTAAHVAEPKPKPNGSMTPPASSTLEQVEERDRAVLLRIKGAGNAGRSVRELSITLGDTEVALASAIDRLRIKKQIRDDGNGKWVSA